MQPNDEDGSSKKLIISGLKVSLIGGSLLGLYISDFVYLQQCMEHMFTEWKELNFLAH